MRTMAELLEGALPFAAMVMVEMGEVGLITVGKAAMTRGMSNFVYVSYANGLGTIILALYFFFQRCRSKGPPLTFFLLCKFFLLGLLGACFVQVFSSLGIRYSSPTLASALGNLIPGLTFLLAVIFRMESIALRSRSSQAKILGTLVSISGAFVVTFYKGPAILHPHLSVSHMSNWVLGGFFIAVTCLSAAAWNILQAAVAKQYPEKMTIVFFSSLFGGMQCAVVSILAERKAGAWTLHSGIEVTAVLYSAIFAVVLRSSILTWCLYKKGPLFVASFKPLGTAVAVVMAVVFLGELPHLGSLIGAAVIALGFYTVMWGQANEETVLSAEKAPLLDKP